ncbi:unnamed protein product [Adineta ricciae]|uniref:G-protein coupled receptors family 1 profile domain-containing protein n=1 Tax=Adineta ricciae TaxID=249248 RepID=A0A814BVI4_ADIRI|nr:unnamed protein product [Adineta ricciae]CAF0933304.1 unnamed protein product [Adineta ricciae]
MSLSLEVNYSTWLDDVTVQLNRYLGLFIFVFGIIGNIFNIFVLSEKTLRFNPCSRLFRCSSVASILASSFGLTTRILSSWNIDLSGTNSYLCKFRGLMAFSSSTVTFWLVASATIDRWLASSILPSRRRHSTIQNAQRTTFAIVCLSTALYFHLIFCYDANLVGTPMKCYSKSPECRFLTDLSFGLITILCPLVIMIIFGLMTISNIRQAHYRAVRQSVYFPAKQRKQVDRQLLTMLLLQVTLLLILSLPLPIQRFYSTFTSSDSKSIQQKSVDNFLYNSSLLLIYVANSVPFYIYTISGGSTFRKALKNVFKRCRQVIIWC